MPKVRRHRATMVETVSALALEDMTFWGTGGIGIALMRPYLAGEMAYLSDLTPYTALSEAQLRRRLDTLSSKGLVIKLRDEKGKFRYTPSPPAAEAYLQRIHELFELQNAKLIAG